MATVNAGDLRGYFRDEGKARALLEELRWPDGPVCPHCGKLRQAWKLEPTTKGKTHVRSGLWKCAVCRREFTVTIGTIFERSHVDLRVWLKLIHRLCTIEKGLSASKLVWTLGSSSTVTYRSIWFMLHRIRNAMTQVSFREMLRLEGVEAVAKAQNPGMFRKQSGPLKIPLPFNKAVIGLLQVKPQARKSSARKQVKKKKILRNAE